MHSKQQFSKIFCGALALATIVTLVIGMFVTPVLAQNAVPPTARQAAAMPEFASRLAHPATPPAARKPRVLAPPRLRAPSPQGRVIYSNGPANGTTDAWTINFGYVVSDSISLGSGNTVTGFDFYTWEFPGDVLSSVDWSITSDPNGGTVYGSGTVGGSNLIDTFISTNQFGYDVDKISASGLNVSPPNGTAWLNLYNAVVPSGDPVYWDENSGPSQAYESSVGSIPSEAFEITGGPGPCGYEEPEKPTPAPGGQAQNFQVIYNFTGDPGGYPNAGLTLDKAGNLYGATRSGVEPYFYGIAYRLKQAGSGWTFSNLYTFNISTPQGGDYLPMPGPLSFGPDGILYGTTRWGGSNDCDNEGCGTVYSLKPPATDCENALCRWTETILYSFRGGKDGFGPTGNLAFDEAANLYGTTNGWTSGDAIVYQLTPSNGGWKLKVLYSFTGGSDGGATTGSVIFDKAGNLYGATYNGGAYGCGTVFQLSPSGSGWKEKTLHTFLGGNNGGSPVANLVMDQSGNLYGITEGYPQVVFMLSPSGGNWAYSVIYNSGGLYSRGGSPVLSMDATGTLYGTFDAGGSQFNGNVFKLTGSGGGWEYTDLYDFTGGSDGAGPAGDLAIDPNGNIYGATWTGGAYGWGAAYEITP